MLRDLWILLPGMARTHMIVYEKTNEYRKMCICIHTYANRERFACLVYDPQSHSARSRRPVYKQGRATWRFVGSLQLNKSESVPKTGTVAFVPAPFEA